VKVVLHDHTGELGPQLHGYAQRKLSRLERHYGRIEDAEVEFTAERKRSGLATIVCRLTAHLNGHHAQTLTARERGPDAQAALDLAIDKLDRQVVKAKEKRTHRKQPVSPVRVPPEEPPPANSRSGQAPERIRMKLKPETEQDAIRELEADGQSFRVFLDEDSGEIEIAFVRIDGSVAIIEPIVV
jgi:putative sigma-54 modulation protein